MKSNIVLIGMPGSGKSTLGVLLAKATKHGFIDTDLLIQSFEERTLQDIIDTNGYQKLRDMEQNIILKLDCQNQIIATGGSAVYGPQAMKKLSDNGIVVFLDVDITTLESRIGNFATRGLAKRPDQTFEDLFEERNALYRKYADIIVDCSKLNHEQACDTILASLQSIA